MPMIDVYAAEDTFKDKHTLAQDLAKAVMRWEPVPQIPLFLDNTAAFIHDLPADAISNAAGESNYIRVQVLTPIHVLDREKQLGVVKELTEIVVAAAGDPGLADRTWVLITESPEGAWRLNASNVHFAPGARTAWHRHPNGQTIYVTDGVGRAQRRGGLIEVIRPGDRVFFEPGEDHWHGAAPDRFMTHLSMVEVDDKGNSATWGAHVSDEEYAAALKMDEA